MTTTPLPLEVPDYNADQKEANEARVRDTHAGTCLICGRPLTRSAADNGYWVHMSTGWQIILPDDDESDSQGCFPVGSECAKRIPTEYRIKQAAAPKVAKPKPRLVETIGSTKVWEVTMPSGITHRVSQSGRIFYFFDTQYAFTMTEVVTALANQGA